MNYDFYFKYEKEASLFVEQAREIAKEYGRVTLSDLYDLSGCPTCYVHSKISWSVYSIKNNVYVKYNNDLECYIVSFPEPYFNKVDNNKVETTTTPKSYVVKKKSETSSEPLNITICMDLLEDPFEVVHEIFDMTNKIKDRPVFITIS